MDLGIDAGHALQDAVHRGMVRMNLRRRDGRLISTNERDENEGEVHFSRSELRVPRDDEDLDLGMTINVTHGW